VRLRHCLVEPTPEPVPSSEEEEDEEEETLEVVRSDTPLPVHEPTPQVSGQRSSLVGPVRTLLTVRDPLGPSPVMGADEFAVRTSGIRSVYTCCALAPPDLTVDHVLVV